MTHIPCSMQEGFTLIELIVVLAVLTFVLGATVNIFISMLQGQRTALRDQDLFDQANYALESMSQLIMNAQKDNTGSCLGAGYEGYNYLLQNYDASSGFYQGIKFLSKDGICEQFFLDQDGVLKHQEDSSSAQNILSDSFEVKYARFVINGDKSILGSYGGDSVQPRVTISLDIRDKSSDTAQDKIIETTISKRGLNIQ